MKSHDVSIKCKKGLNRGSRMIGQDAFILIDGKRLEGVKSAYLRMARDEAVILTIQLMPHSLEIEGPMELATEEPCA